MAAEEVVIGVDFGTTNSVVAVLKPDGVEVLANDIDKRSTPSCVYVKDGEREVGEAALRWATCYPANIIRNVKSVLGHPLNSITGRHQLGTVTIEPSPCEKSITVNIEGVGTLPIEEIAAMVLREMKKIATMQLDGEVEKAVIAVPSYFRASQRRAVMDSAYLAGLEAVELVNETTAAAAAYAHDREDSKTVIIVDIGGGGSSASIVKVQCNTVEVLAHSGTRLPGGDDFDAKMVEYLKECVENESKVEVDDPRDCEILLSHWRKAKEKLSRIPQAVIAVFLPSCKREFKHEVKRVDFEAICGEMFGEISKGLQKLQDSCKVAASAAEEVLLIGGSSRIPHLRALVLKVLNKAKALSKAINPDEAVAEGAALLAAKCVVLKQEVLALRTELTINDDVVIRHPNSVLPFYQEVPSKRMSFWGSTIEVLQEANNGLMLPILCKRRRDTGSIEITESGILCVRDSKRGEIKFILDGCLAPCNLGKYRKRLEAHTKTELDELSRVESKNALEKLLRVERGKEVSENDWYYEDIMELQNECEKHLTWLSEHSNESASKYDELRSEVEDKIATLNSKLEYESNRAQAEKCLRETLLATAEADIPQDPFQVKALELKALCYKKLRELEERTRLSTEELDQELQIILQKTEDLATKRKRHASEQRSLKARELLEETILTAHQTWKTQREKVDAAIFAAHDRSFGALYQTATRWLKDHKALENGEAEFNRERDSFESEFSLIKNRLLKDIKSAEETRQRCYKAAEAKVVEALSIQLPKQDDPLYKLTKKYNDKWAASLERLLNNPSIPMSTCVRLSKSIDEEIQDLRQAQALQKERVRYKNLIDEKLANGYEEFKDSLLCNLRSAFHKWLNENPQAANTSLEQYSARVAEVVQGFHTANSHQLNQEKESAAAKQAYEKAAADSKKLLSDFGFTDAPPCQAGSTSCCRGVWSSPSVPYAPADFTKSVAEEKMDVENDIQPQLNHFAEENRGREKQSTATGFLGSGAAVDEQTMLTLWKLVQQPSDQQWSQLDPASPQSQVVQLMLECLAEELAVDALSSAGLAGCMALLLDRESTPGKDLVSLSVRYVGSSERAEERLLLVLDRRNFSESPQDFARRVLEHFKALCCRAYVKWLDCLRYLSVSACGDFAPYLASFLRDEGCLGLQEVDSVSNPLDNRIAVKSYRQQSVHTEPHTLITFFSIVDTLRQKLAFGSKWFPLLVHHCKIREDYDPWLTYASSVDFMYVHRTELSELLARVAMFDPKERFLMDSLTDKMKEYSFISCLVTFDGVFNTVLQHVSDVATNPSSDWKSFLSRLEGNKGVFLDLSFQDAIIDRIKTTTGQHILPRTNPVHPRVRGILALVIGVVRHTLESFQDCLYVKTCLDPLKSVFNGSPSYDKVVAQLSSLKNQCPKASFDSPECVLRLASRERQPELFVALQRALTVPLIPPQGQRSAEQLREAVRNTATILPVVGHAALPLAVRADPPLPHTVSQAVARVNARCLELASSDCSMETEV